MHILLKGKQRCNSKGKTGLWFTDGDFSVEQTDRKLKCYSYYEQLMGWLREVPYRGVL